MKPKSTLAAIGGYQPFLFCVGMYFVALFFSIFICSAIFYAINPRKSVATTASVETSKTPIMNSGNQVMLSVTK
jgi:hypothetical protein